MCPIGHGHSSMYIILQLHLITMLQLYYITDILRLDSLFLTHSSHTVCPWSLHGPSLSHAAMNNLAFIHYTHHACMLYTIHIHAHSQRSVWVYICFRWFGAYVHHVQMNELPYCYMVRQTPEKNDPSIMFQCIHRTMIRRCLIKF